ncbi:MAG: hypothetical protein V1922_05835 [bacterium]
MAAEKKPTFGERISRTALLGGVLAGLRIASLSLFSLATANFLAGGVLIGAALGGVIGLLDTMFGSKPAQPTS